ncbi:unnamed protein product [Nesidiocoris tenuis]|uniref:FOXO protein transactivation domain-containing protein n=1 Tax=Nesidiocoris tenuis TaxID=355587 RepID=A0A6H5GQ94_9HEMI|nr:unnamed protein product [Nesidiocoris tenuis]
MVDFQIVSNQEDEVSTVRLMRIDKRRLGGFLIIISPDFRPRASSNASSCGRLSPIPAADGEWGGYYGPEQLAGSLEQNMRLGQVGGGGPPGGGGGAASAPATPQDLPSGGFAYPPPPPYRPAPPYVPHCPVHRMQMHPCPSCAVAPKQQRMGFGEGESAATMMGQLMGALNPTMLDDLNINIETLPLHGGFDCNVDEVIKHELSLDGTLDFNFTGQSTGAATNQEQQPFSGHSFPTVHNYGRDFPVFTGEIPSPSACGKEGKFLGNSAEPSERGYRTADRDEETGGVGGGKIGGGKPAGVEAAPVWQRQRRQWASLHLIRPRRPRAVPRPPPPPPHPQPHPLSLSRSLFHLTH